MSARLILPIIRLRNHILVETKTLSPFLICRYKSTKSAITSTRSDVTTDVRPLGEKVKETTKTVSYLGIILLGVGVTGTLFYAVFNELFSRNSPNNIYSAAVKRCLADYRIEDKLGLPIKAYGEETRRGRRQHPSYAGFLDTDGKKHIQMKFYLKGAVFKGTAYLEMKENEAGNYDYLYLMVEIDDMARTTIVLENNRVQRATEFSSLAF